MSMMKQWTLFPTVLQRKFLLTLLAGIASAGISVIICVATKDHILLALGIVVLCACLISCRGIWATAAHKNYEVVEGICAGIGTPINLSENTISVNHNLIYRVIDGKAGFHITTPKTESGTRIIPILYPEVAEQLRLQIETIDALYPDDQLVLGGVHGFVFRNRTGSFMSAHNINRAIERISVTYNMEEMDQAELEDREPDLLPHFSVHNLRHTFCTRLCESTNDVKFIQQVMGHADFSTTMDIYTHITQENMQEKAKNISVNMKLM